MDAISGYLIACFLYCLSAILGVINMGLVRGASFKKADEKHEDPVLMTKTAEEVMTPIESTFSLAMSANLDWEKIGEILSKGYSHVPLYSGNPENLLAIMPVTSLLKVWGVVEPIALLDAATITYIPRVRADTPLHEVFLLFRKEAIYMAAVIRAKTNTENQKPEEESQQRAPVNRKREMMSSKRVVGIVTFKDVIQELLKDKGMIAKLHDRIKSGGDTEAGYI